MSEIKIAGYRSEHRPYFEAQSDGLRLTDKTDQTGTVRSKKQYGTTYRHHSQKNKPFKNQRS